MSKPIYELYKVGDTICFRTKNDVEDIHAEVLRTSLTDREFIFCALGKNRSFYQGVRVKSQTVIESLDPDRKFERFYHRLCFVNKRDVLRHYTSDSVILHFQNAISRLT